MKNSLHYVGGYMTKWLFIATVMGIGGGLSAVALYQAIHYTTIVGGHFPLWIAPAVGGFIICWIYWWDREAMGFGTNRYIQAINRRNGYIKSKTLLSKLAATAITLGFFGSGGVEGPMVMMGGSLANIIARIPFINKYLVNDDRRILTICGAAGAIGAIFRSPLGGGIFVVEVLYRSSLHYADLFPAMLSSTIGFVIYSMLASSKPLFSIPDYLPNVFNLPFFVMAAVLAGLASLVFMWFFDRASKTFLMMKRFRKIRPIIGGLLTGGVIVFLPQVSGIGLQVIQDMILGAKPLSFLMLLLIGKILATSFTVGSGGSGGLVIPALFVGAICGNALAGVVANGDLGLTASLVTAGMAASLASIANVPIAAAVMLVEMVGLRLGVPATMGSIIGYAIGHSKIIYGTTQSLQTDFETGKKFRINDRHFDEY